MATLPYPYRFVDRFPDRRYVVFRVNAGGAVTIAYGGKSQDGKCPAAPRLAAERRRGPKPIPAAGPQPLICFDDNGWRLDSPESATVTRSNAVNLIAEALCEEAYEGYESFTCFD